jgi:hypothetical protein
MAVEILSKNPTDKIYYSINGNNNATKEKNWKLYTEPWSINEIPSKKLTTTEIQVTLCQPTSLKPNNYSVAIKSKYNSQYTAGGIEGLIDGINGK